jgi:hypothetical protein
MRVQAFLYCRRSILTGGFREKWLPAKNALPSTRLPKCRAETDRKDIDYKSTSLMQTLSGGAQTTCPQTDRQKLILKIEYGNKE